MDIDQVTIDVNKYVIGGNEVCVCVLSFLGGVCVILCTVVLFVLLLCSCAKQIASTLLLWSDFSFFFAGLSNGSHRQIRRSCVCLFNREGQTTQRYASRASYFFSPIFFLNPQNVCACVFCVCVCVCVYVCVCCVCTLLRTSADYRRIKRYGRAPKPEVHVCVCMCVCV